MQIMMLQISGYFTVNNSLNSAYITDIGKPDEPCQENSRSFRVLFAKRAFNAYSAYHPGTKGWSGARG